MNLAVARSWKVTCGSVLLSWLIISGRAGAEELPLPLPNQPGHWQAGEMIGSYWPDVVQTDVCDGTCLAPCNSRTSISTTIGCRSNTCLDGVCWLGEYRQRAVAACSNTSRLPHPTSLTPQFGAWWDQLIQNATGLARQPQPLRVDELIRSALVNSPHIQVAAAEPHIRHTVMVEEWAAFDWRAFLNTEYDTVNDPVGNTLTTGNNESRFKEREWFGEAGLRRKNRAGGQFEISERFGTLRNNSRFLLPPEQGNARLQLNYTQPLLNGHGRYVNESLYVLARIDYNTSTDEYLIQLQDHLMLVTEAYWELYRARANYFQRRKLLESATSILENLKGRSEVDSLDRQILRATAAVANRKSEISRSLTSIRNAESQLRLLVNDPQLMNSSCKEFVPLDIPLSQRMEPQIGDAISTALSRRPDISRAIRDLRGTTVRLGVAENDLLPQLDLVLRSYVAGLQGNNDVYNAYTAQFQDGGPGFTVGLQFEVPLGNRAARARHERRSWEMTQAVARFRSVAESAMTEVEVALREVTTTHDEMSARYQAMKASDDETAYLIDRWETLPDIDDSATLLLEDLLDSQSRLADEEGQFVAAQVSYAIALVRFRQAMGTLIQVHPTH